jgi:hypothetical protein
MFLLNVFIVDKGFCWNKIEILSGVIEAFAGTN